MNRMKIAQYIALAATGLTVVGFIIYKLGGTGVSPLFFFLGAITGLAAYLFGGLFSAIKMAGGIAKWGLICVPFPINLLTFVMSFMVALMIFVLLPIIPIRKAYKEKLA